MKRIFRMSDLIGRSHVFLCMVFLLPALLSLSTVLKAQQQSPYQVNLPQILPASPEATAFVKAGMANANLSTGAATASIPLYTIKIKDYTFPISLSYSTQGFKVDERATRVGYQWVLNATGMITRSVKGAPDELAVRLTAPTDYNTYSDSLFTYYLRATDLSSGYDTQADEFSFNVNGYSGKFVLDNNRQARVTSTSNLIIDVQMSQPGSGGYIGNIFITTPDGVKYQFGTNYEITTDASMMSYSPYKLAKTAFFLDHIFLATGEDIQFNYSEPQSYTVNTGVTQTLVVNKGLTILGSIDSGCITCSGSNSYTNKTDHVVYNTKFLNQIKASNGLTVNFTNSGTGENATLNNIEILQDNTSSLLKKYQLDYIIGGGRYFLTSLMDITDPTVPLGYSFNYDRLDQAPLALSFAQDGLGFYNGNNIGYFIPQTTDVDGNIDFSFRNPSATYSSIGTLKKIQYPTGGTEEFFYEGNTYFGLVPHNALRYLRLSGVGNTDGEIPEVYLAGDISVDCDQIVTIDAYSVDNDPTDNISNPSPSRTAWVQIKDMGTGESSQTNVLGYDHTTFSFPMQAGHIYKMELDVFHLTETGFVTMTYNDCSTPTYDNIPMPGVRVKQIKSSDPLTSSTFNKYFTYAGLSDLSRSTGGSMIPVFKTASKIDRFCGPHNSSVWFCLNDVYTTSSTNSVYNYSSSGSPIYYKQVIESNDLNFVNGGTEYTFYDNDDGNNSTPVKGDEIAYLSGGHLPTLTGILSKKRLFDVSKTVVEETQYDYETLIDLSHSVKSVYVGKSGEAPGSDIYQLNAFDVAEILYGNYWIRPKTETTKKYEGSGVQTILKTTNYGTTSNVLPSSIVTTDSKGSVLRTETKYPNTYVPVDDNDLSAFGYSGLITMNILTPVVQQLSYKDDILQQQKKILYKAWASNVIKPEKIQVMESPSDGLHDALIYNSYSPNANPLQLQKANDFLVNYLWDETLSLPIAEVRKATTSQIAYTSFENGANGNWTLNGTIKSHSGYTGPSSFSGTLSYSTEIGGSYTISLWANHSNTTAPTINFTSGQTTSNNVAGTLLRNAKGWDLYQWTVTNPSLVTINTNDTNSYIDEVRLRPADALMETFTYRPFVGLLAKSDVNNVAAFFDYDLLGRLTTISDANGKILKQYDYHYASFNSPGDVNSVTSSTILSDNITDPATLGNLTADQLTQTIGYIDGLGRPLQNVVKQGSYQYQDIVTPIVYDNFGREYRKYLPAVTGNDGSYKSGLLDANGNYAGAALNFYNNSSDKIADDPKPFSETKFESSPLNRVAKQGATGTTWQPDSDLNSTTDRTVKHHYELNGATDVILFKYNVTSGLVTTCSSGQVQYYDANQLQANRTTDEHQNDVIEYVDKLGHTVCKKVQYKTDAQGNKLYACTYYIYDDIGNLVIVLQPEAVEHFLNTLTSQN